MCRDSQSCGCANESPRAPHSLLPVRPRPCTAQTNPWRKQVWKSASAHKKTTNKNRALVAWERNTNLEEPSRPWKVFLRTTMFLFAFSTSFLHLRKFSKGGRKPGLVRHGQGLRALPSPFCYPHMLLMLISRRRCPEGPGTRCSACKGADYKLPQKNLLTVAMQWGKYTRNVIFLLNCIKLMTFPSPFALL